MGERILDRMNRLYKEYQQEHQVVASIQATVTQPTAAVVPRAPISSETIDAPASPDELRRARTHARTGLLRWEQFVINTWVPAV